MGGGWDDSQRAGRGRGHKCACARDVRRHVIAVGRTRSARPIQPRVTRRARCGGTHSAYLSHTDAVMAENPRRTRIALARLERTPGGCSAVVDGTEDEESAPRNGNV